MAPYSDFSLNCSWKQVRSCYGSSFGFFLKLQLEAGSLLLWLLIRIFPVLYETCCLLVLLSTSFFILKQTDRCECGDNPRISAVLPKGPKILAKITLYKDLGCLQLFQRLSSLLQTNFKMLYFLVFSHS
jgi:hypothetical protein